MRPIYEIALEIRREWRNVRYSAEPYLAAMAEITDINQDYYAESARGVVLRFLDNAKFWRGPAATRLKDELKAHLTGATPRQ